MSTMVVDIGTQTLAEKIASKIGNAIGIGCSLKEDTYNGGDTFFVGATKGNSVAAVNFNNDIFIINDDDEIFYRMSNDSNCWVEAFHTPYDIDIHETCILVYDNPINEQTEIHLLGGYGYKNRIHYKWDGESWSIASELPYDFCAGKAVEYNGEIHIFGGGPDHYQVFLQDNWLNYHYKWDGSFWTKVSEPTFNLCGSTPVVYNNSIKIVGGISDGNQVWSFSNDKWTKSSSIPSNITGLINPSINLYNGEIHVAGGVNKSGTKINTHITYSDSGGWAYSHLLPVNAYGDTSKQLVVNDEKLWVIGYQAYSLSESTSIVEPTEGINVTYNDSTNTLIFDKSPGYIDGNTLVIIEGNSYVDGTTLVLSFDDSNSGEATTTSSGWVSYMRIPTSVNTGKIVTVKSSENEHILMVSNNSMTSLYDSMDIRMNGKVPYDITPASLSVDTNDGIHIITDYNGSNIHFHYAKSTITDGYMVYKLDDNTPTLPIYMTGIASIWYRNCLHLVGKRENGFNHYKLYQGSWVPVSIGGFSSDDKIRLVVLNDVLYAITIKGNTLNVYWHNGVVGWYKYYSYTIDDDILDFDTIVYNTKIHVALITSGSTNDGIGNKVEHYVFSGDKQYSYIPFNIGAKTEIKMTVYNGYINIFVSDDNCTENYCVKYHIDDSRVIEVFLPVGHKFICKKDDFIPIVGIVEDSDCGYISTDSGIYKFITLNSSAIYSIS